MTTLSKKWKKDSKVQKKRKRVQSACTHCQKSHSSCDDERPCRRCISKGLEDQCKDGMRKRRGRKMKDEENTNVVDDEVKKISEFLENEFGGYYIDSDVYLKDIDSQFTENIFEERHIQFTPNTSCFELFKDINNKIKRKDFLNSELDDSFANKTRNLPPMCLYDSDYHNFGFDIYPEHL